MRIISQGGNFSKKIIKMRIFIQIGHKHLDSHINDKYYDFCHINKHLEREVIE